MSERRSGDDSLSAEEVYERLEPFEPYTTDELASEFAVERGIIRRLLDRLTSEEKIRQKKPAKGRSIWVREPPKNRCPNCDREFEVKYLHAVLSAVQYCPRCGTQL